MAAAVSIGDGNSHGDGFVENGEDDQERSEWTRFKEGGSQSARGWLICHHEPLVDRVMTRYFSQLPDSFDKEGIHSAGVIRLIGAVDSFLPDKSNRFPPYAVRSIRWGLVDAIRQENWLPAAETPEPPDSPDLASPKQRRTFHFQSLEGSGAWEEGEETGAERPFGDSLFAQERSVAAQCETTMARAMLVRAFAHLPERQRILLLGMIDCDWTIREAAHRTARGPRSAWISQQRAIRSLRQIFGDDALLRCLLDP